MLGISNQKTACHVSFEDLESSLESDVCVHSASWMYAVTCFYCIDFHKNTLPCEKWNFARRSSCQPRGGLQQISDDSETDTHYIWTNFARHDFRAKEFTPHPLLYWVRRSREFALPAAEISESDSLLLLTNSSGVSSNLY